MAEMLLEFYVKDQTLVRKKDGQIPRKDSEGYLFLKFNFIGQTWENLNIIPWIGYQDENKQAWSVKSDTVVDLNRYQVPVEYLGQNYFLVSLSGTGSDGFKISTNVVKVSLAEASSEIIDLPNLPEDSGGQSIVDLISTAISMGNQIIYAKTSDGINYIASKSNTLPTIATGSGGTHKGKGTQIVFIPDGTNRVTLPTLKIGNGEAIPIRLRSASNKGIDDQAPDATDDVPVGALMAGVPYAMTFCGLYWLVDSMIGGVGGQQGETTLPVAHAESGDGIAYTATDAGSGCTLPTVQTGGQSTHIGKGRQIVFIPYDQNRTNTPTLQLNGGEIIPIRLRAPKNQGSQEQSPDATLPVPVGALMIGVPYTMTFCGKYWLVDSMIYSGIPLPTAADAGKVLTASADGSAAWVAVTNAEEVAV